MSPETQIEIEATVLRRLLDHLRCNPDVQNIDLMILANFCRNCLSKWYQEAAAQRGEEITDETAREAIYGMPYSEWKSRFQAEASPEQLMALKKRQSQH